MQQQTWYLETNTHHVAHVDVGNPALFPPGGAATSLTFEFPPPQPTSSAATLRIQKSTANLPDCR